jgi:acetyl esterase
MARESLVERARRRVGSAVVDGFFNGVSRMGQLHPRARPERHGVEVIRDVAYVEGSDRLQHRLDVYRPVERNGRPHAALLYVHGGGFRILSKDTHWMMGLAFARKGYVVFNASYRLAPEHPFPAGLDDVSRAYEWVVRHASEWGADPTRLVLAGESAGANLVTALTLASVYERPESFAKRVHDTGVVPIAALPACGILQVSDVARFARRKATFPRFIQDRLDEVERSYLGRDRDRHGTSIDFADPLVWLERGEKPMRPLPPFFLPVGTRDPLLDDTRRMAVALEKLGVHADPRYYEGEVHAFHAFIFRENARLCWQHMYEFLDANAPALAER